MPASVAMPAVRQNRSKLAPTCCQASSTIAAGTTSAAVVYFFMALLSFVASAPRAYWLKAGNAYLTFSTSAGTFPQIYVIHPTWVHSLSTAAFIIKGSKCQIIEMALKFFDVIEHDPHKKLLI